ncbi:MAG: hypothetical protein PVF15_02530 [Candidatus Bathyarchaeota archaeon]
MEVQIPPPRIFGSTHVVSKIFELELYLRKKDLRENTLKPRARTDFWEAKRVRDEAERLRTRAERVVETAKQEAELVILTGNLD